MQTGELLYQVEDQHLREIKLQADLTEEGSDRVTENIAFDADAVPKPREEQQEVFQYDRTDSSPPPRGFRWG